MTAEEYRALREGAGLSQEGLARLVGVHPMTISKRERGEINVTKEAATVLRMVVALREEA